ncbi:MAG: MMPL family transporter, partial [Verrucomicrobia bacterium]|nr:MMPL family transporter [Verrucomicrobiota bacterium]
MKPLSSDSFLARLLGRLAAVIIRRPRWIFYPQIVLLGVSILYTARYLGFDMKQDDLVGSNKPYHRRFLEFEKEFPEPSDLVVVAQSGDPEKNREFVERIGAKMEAETNLFADVMFKPGDLEKLGPKALMFLSNTDLVSLRDTLRDDLPFVQKFTETTNLNSFFDQVNTLFRTAPQQTNAQTESLIGSLPALRRIVAQAQASLVEPGPPLAPGLATLFGAGQAAEQQEYITFNNGRIFLATAHAPTDALNAAAVQRLQQLVAETEMEVPGVNAGLTGEPVLDYDQMLQSERDVTLASVVSLFLSALIFVYGYNETGRPIKATLCLVVGMAYTLAFATATVGYLNILTVTFVPMLIGLSIDYGVHLITRYEEELRYGKKKEEALTTAMMFTGKGIVTGALTTAGAFLAMCATDFKGIQQMGVICGGGLLLCWVPMMTLLPVLLLRGRQNVMDYNTAAMERRARIENVWLERPLVVTALTVACCAAAATQIHKVHFDYDLLHMQSPGLPSVIYEQKLIDTAGKSVLFGAVVADTRRQALALQTKLEHLTNTVADVESVAGFLDGHDREKLNLIGEIKRQVAPLHFQTPDTRPVDTAALGVTLYSLDGYLGDAAEAVATNDPALTAQLTALRDTIENFTKTMLAPDGIAPPAVRLAEYQDNLFDNIHDIFQTLRNQDDSGPMRVRDLPPALRHRFIGINGQFLLQVYPKKDLWQRANQKQFIDAVSKVCPNVTGTPVQLYQYTNLLKTSYIQAAWYSLIAIALMVWLHFRSVVAMILSLIPVGIGSLWLVGLMGASGTEFNPANIMTLPLLVGIGVTNGIQILNRYAEERTPSILTRSTGKAVLVSGLTAISGFGSLILAKHQGIHSLGCVMATGIATCMVAGLTFLPALLNLIARWHPLIKQPSAGRVPTPG